MASKNIKLQRWQDILAYAIFSYILLKLAFHSEKVTSTYQSWSNLVTSLALWQILFLIALGLTICFKLITGFKIFNKNHRLYIKDQFKYPPLYFSVFICILISFVDGNIQPPSAKLSTTILISLYLIFCVIIHFHYESLKAPNTETQSLELSNAIEMPAWLENSDNLYLKNFYIWLNREQPINNYNEDAFNREVYIQRIINKLNDNSKAHHIAIIGKFGAGKSSISKVIEKSFKVQSNKVIFTSIDGWGISEKSCSTYILEEIVNALAEHIDCFSIRKIPQEYLGALSNSSITNSKSIASLLSIHNYQPPLYVLEKINSILITIDKRMVVILEDFDRTTKANEVVNELAALLDRLREFEKISFIINIGNQNSFDVISRIVTYREDLSDISAVNYLSQFFDLAVFYETKKNGFSLNDDKSIIHGTSEELTAFIKTPRDIKNVLRRVFDSWIYLAGEVDLYDLININAIRYVEPNAFNLISKNINQLQTQENNTKNTIIKEIESVSSDENKNSINNITSSLFESSDASSLRNQRITYTGETDYFKRVLEERIDHRSDVEALKYFITLCNTEPKSIYLNNDVITKICESKFLQEKICQFGYALQDETPIFKPIHIYWIYNHLLRKKANLSEFINRFFSDYFSDNYISDYWNEIMSFSIKNDFNAAKMIVGRFINNKKIFDNFIHIFLREIDTPEKFINLIPDLTENDLSIMLRPTPDSSSLANLIINAFALNPNKVVLYITKIFARYISFNALEYNQDVSELWQPYKILIKDTFNKMDQNSIDYPHDMHYLIEEYKVYFNKH